MDQNVSSQGSIVHRHDMLNYVATGCLPRDQQQSRRLPEPERIMTNIDPITGRDIGDVHRHPYLVDGNVTMYFETEATRQEYIDMPIDHPFRLQDNPTDEWVANG
jgi:hypothetical protein